MVKEELSQALHPLEEAPGFIGYAVIKTEGIVIHSVFSDKGSPAKAALPQLVKIISSLANLGEGVGGDTNYLLIDSRDYTVLIVPITEGVSASVFLLKGSDVNGPYKQISSLKKNIAELVK